MARQGKKKTFYATLRDLAILKEIQQRRPHFSINFAIREGLRLLLNQLRAEDRRVGADTAKGPP